MIGVRIARNSPVLFIDGNGLLNKPGDVIVVELSTEKGIEVEATVVIGAGQMLSASLGELAGRALRTA